MWMSGFVCYIWKGWSRWETECDPGKCGNWQILAMFVWFLNFKEFCLKSCTPFIKSNSWFSFFFFLENKLTPLEGLKRKLAFILIWFLSIMYEHWADLPGLPMQTDRPAALIYFPWRNIFVLRGKKKKKKGIYKDLCRLFKVIRKHAQLVKSNSEDANLGSVPLN